MKLEWMSFECYELITRRDPIYDCLMIGRSDWINEEDGLVFSKYLIVR